MIKGLSKRTGQTFTRVNRVDFEQIQTHHSGIDGIALLEQGRSFTWVGSDGAESISSTQASPNLLGILGIGAALGRPLGPGDEVAEPRPAMLTYSAWRRRFGADPSAVGRTITFDEGRMKIVGVLPPRFIFPFPGLLFDGDLLILSAPDPSEVGNPKAGVWTPIARLKAGVSIAQAQAEIDTLVRRAAQQYPETSQDRALRVSQLQFALFEVSRPLLWILVSASAFVLLIACSNLASLLMARGTGRQREIAIRAAIGAGRCRLIRQLLVESLVLSVLGAAVGVLMGASVFEILSTQVPPRYRLVPEELDLRAIAFAFSAAVACCALFGTVPALRLSMANLESALRRGPSDPNASSAVRAGTLLIAAEATLGMILLCGAGLMVNSFVRARTVELGFEPSRAILLNVNAPRSRYPTQQHRFDFQMTLLDRVRQVPGVLDAGGIDSPQTGGFAPPRGLGAGIPRDSGLWSVTPGYFAAMRMSIADGRDFTARESQGDVPVAILNQTAAAFFWPGQRAIGRVLRLEKQPPMEIVGIVSDVRYGYGRSAVASVYRPVVPADFRMLFVVARVSGDVSAAAARIRTEAQRLDPHLVVARPDTIASSLHKGFADSRFQTTLFGLFAGLGLALAAIGIYGVIGYWVIGRTREMGIRLALGAAPRDLRRLVVRQAMLPVMLGLSTGLLAAFALTRQLESLLYEITPHDPTTLAAAAVLLLTVGLIAAYVPARRASRVDPLVALRAE